jgi:hypothetical protein
LDILTLFGMRPQHRTTGPPYRYGYLRSPHHTFPPIRPICVMVGLLPVWSNKIAHSSPSRFFPPHRGAFCARILGKSRQRGERRNPQVDGNRFSGCNHSRIADLEEVYETERHLLYVACTRARDHLLVTGVKPASEFLDDLVG